MSRIFLFVSLLICVVPATQMSRGHVQVAVDRSALHSNRMYALTDPSFDTRRTKTDSSIPPMINGSLRYGVDTTTAPCDDFYQYANGDWRAKTKFAPDSLTTRRSRDMFADTYERTEQRLQRLLDSAQSVMATTPDPMLRAIGAFFASCLTVDTLERTIATPKSSRSLVRELTRAEQCRQRTIQRLGDPLGFVFGTDIFAGNALPRMQRLLDAIQKSAVTQVNNNPWMTANEKAIAAERLGKLKLRVGMPKSTTDYSGLVLSPTQYHENKVVIANFKNASWISSMGDKNHESWLMSLLMPNAVYMSGAHVVEIPAVMFMLPFFDPNGEDAINFAGIGYVIGHEVFHSVAGQLLTIENPTMAQNIKRLKDFYTAMSPLDGWVPNGDRTFGEDVADLGGVRVAYNAWKSVARTSNARKNDIVDGYTPDQRFFLAVARVWRAKWGPDQAKNADVHSPPFARVNGMMMHMPEFAKAFGCKEGDPMVPSADKRAVIW